MRPPRKNSPDWWPHQPASDTELLVEAIFAILTAVITIVIVILRHPFMMLAILIVTSMVGAVASWW